MRKKLAVLLAVLFCFQFTALADIDPNIDGGGGGMGGGSSGSFWSAGWDGVRISIIDSETQENIRMPLNITNKNVGADYIHCGRVNKIQYRNGHGLIPKNEAYISYQLVTPLPPIIDSASFPADIERTRMYFSSENVLKAIAAMSSLPYDTLINGNFKLLIEPMSYFTLDGQKYAMTATEVALYDQLTAGSVRSKLVSMSHKNLPLALFLSKPTLGFQPWTGSKSTAASNNNIINFLGIGVVSFEGDNDTDGGVVTGIETGEYVYRADTDVITSVHVTASQNITPSAPASVTFQIKSSTYTVNNIVVPAGDSQVVWVKWHTPATPQQFNIAVTCSGGGVSSGTIPVRIVLMEENEPPDPTLKDKSPAKGPYPTWTKPDIPEAPVVAVAAQGAVTSTWQPNIQWVPNVVTEQQPVWNPMAKWVQEKKWVTVEVHEKTWNFKIRHRGRPWEPLGQYWDVSFATLNTNPSSVIDTTHGGHLIGSAIASQFGTNGVVPVGNVSHSGTFNMNADRWVWDITANVSSVGGLFFGYYTVENHVDGPWPINLIYDLMIYETASHMETIQIDNSHWEGAWQLKSVTVDRGAYKDLGKYVYTKNTYTQSLANNASWGIWSAVWIPDWRYVGTGRYTGNEKDGYTEIKEWKDFGDWAYTFTSYTATLTADMKVLIDERCPSADRDTKTMKSGYGMTVECSTNVITNAPVSHVTGAQNALSYYPDFLYKDYWRVSVPTRTGLQTDFRLRNNWYSHYDDPVHFTPWWYPDGLDYTIIQEVIDCWTPAGMLSVRRSDFVNIDGGTVLDDWHVGPLPVD